jgi:hypothetical protein
MLNFEPNGKLLLPGKALSLSLRLLTEAPGPSWASVESNHSHSNTLMELAPLHTEVPAFAPEGASVKSLPVYACARRLSPDQ